MKVVLFCGGLGLRLREHSATVPKPMVQIGSRPVLWHVMRYYAHFGHRDFILCLGYGATAIKDYFLHYDEALSNDFVFSEGGQRIDLLGSDIQDWRITFADTGLNVTIGERLRAVRPHLEGESIFLANYGDTLTDAPLDRMIDDFSRSDAVATFLSVRPSDYGFHVVTIGDDARVTALRDAAAADLWINGGYFVMRPEIFDALRPGEELVEEPFQRLARTGRLATVHHEGFWAPVDTLRDVQRLETLVEGGSAPWALWQLAPRTERATVRGGGARARIRAVR